jgi:hypothetical protein
VPHAKPHRPVAGLCDHAGMEEEVIPTGRSLEATIAAGAVWLAASSTPPWPRRSNGPPSA